ncbi:MAG TPA: hypothetical protein VGF21_01225 [Thermoleophilaceae bacterium]
MKTAAKFGLIAVVALAVVVLPGGGGALRVALSLLTIGFFAAIALLAVRLYREHRFDLDSLQGVERLVLYASIGVALLTFTATNRLFDRGGAGVLVWLALLALCSYGVFWVWTRYRSYE